MEKQGKEIDEPRLSMHRKFLTLTMGIRMFIILFSVLLCMFETVHKNKNFHRFKTHLTRIYRSPPMTDCLTALPFLSLRGLYRPIITRPVMPPVGGVHISGPMTMSVTILLLWPMTCEWCDVHLDRAEVFEVTVCFHQFSCSFPLPQKWHIPGAAGWMLLQTGFQKRCNQSTADKMQCKQEIN